MAWERKERREVLAAGAAHDVLVLEKELERELEREVVELAQELVRCRSVYDPERGTDERSAARLVEARMRSFGWSVEVTEVAPGRPNVIATLPVHAAGRTLAFEGHLDVVTAGDEARWSVSPFSGEIVGDRLYGRGAADMKAGVAAMIYGARALELAGPFPGTVKICALVDEEGTMAGAKHAAASGALDGVTGMIVCEPEGDEICPSSKGAIRLRLEVTGRMSHGAMPELGCSPLPVLAACVEHLRRAQARLQETHGTHPRLGDLYLTPTTLAAGSDRQMNVIPASGSLCIDVRTIPGVDHRALVDELASAFSEIARREGAQAALGVIDDRPPVDTPEDDPVVRCLVDAHELETGSRPTIGGVPGTTDGTIFTRDLQLPTVVYGPGDKWIAHQADEFVTVGEIVRYARTYARAARQFLTER